MEAPIDLETLIPDGITVKVRWDKDPEGQGREQIVIRPFVWKQFREVTKLIQPIQMHTDEQGELDLMKLIGDHGEEITDIIVVATGKAREWVDGLDLTDVLPLAAAILQVNRDFFSQKLAPQLKELAARLSAGRK